MFSCELSYIFKNTFLESDCFSKYESFKVTSYTSSMKLKIGSIHIAIKIRYRKTSKNKVSGLHFSKAILSGLIMGKYAGSWAKWDNFPRREVFSGELIP